MRSPVIDKILNRTPKHVELFMDKYTDMVVLIGSILKDKSITQKQLAENLGKNPSEINKWLKGQHNFTLETICKLEAELGETLFYVRKIKEFTPAIEGLKRMTVSVNRKDYVAKDFKFIKIQTSELYGAVG